jgi:hypothetical protein
MHDLEPTLNQHDQMCREGKDGRPNFLCWFQDYVDTNGNIDLDLQQLSLGAVTIRSYGRYDANGFRFHYTRFKDAHPLVSTTNSEVKVTNYYRVTKDIPEYMFFGDKN